MDANEFAQDKTIDPSQLDVEACRQADVFFKWAEREVEAKGEADRLKLRLDVKEAKLALSCREKPEDFGLGKVTESAISAAVKAHDDYVELYLKWLRAKRNAALLSKATETMEQKKRMIEVLITLHGQQYFAGPSVPRDLTTAFAEHQQKTEARVNKSQSNRTRRRKTKKGEE